jgi:hypothetical protein
MSAIKSPFGKKRSGSCMTARRKILYIKYNGICQGCGCKTIMTYCNTHKLPKNTATVEHIYHRWDIRRGISTAKDTTLFCFDCNMKGAAKICKEFIHVKKEHFDIKQFLNG